MGKYSVNSHFFNRTGRNTYHYFNESALYDIKDYCLHLAEAFLKEGELVADNEAFKLVNAFNQAVKEGICRREHEPVKS